MSSSLGNVPIYEGFNGIHLYIWVNNYIGKLLTIMGTYSFIIHLYIYIWVNYNDSLP